MSQDPINKNQQFYADRYGNQAPNTEGAPPLEGDYENFDASGAEGPGEMGGLDPSAYGEITNGQLGEGMGDQELINGMSEEEYIAHYRNNVAPQNRQAAHALMAEVGGEGGSAFGARERLSELRADLNKKENVAALDTDVRGDMLGKLRELETLAGKPGTNPEELQNRIEDFREAVQSAIDEAQGTHQEKISTMKSSIDRLLDEVEDSRIPEAKKSELESDLSALKDKLKKTSVDLESATRTLEDIQKSFRKEKIVDQLKEKLESLPSKIPGEGNHNNVSADLAGKIAEAIRTDNWTEVRSKLEQLQQNENLDAARHVIPQVIGTIFKDLADSDEKELDKILGVFPSEIRNLMADVAPGNNGNSNEYLNDPKYKYYGRPNATAARLRSSRIEEEWGHLGDLEGGPDSDH